MCKSLHSFHNKAIQKCKFEKKNHLILISVDNDNLSFYVCGQYLLGNLMKQAKTCEALNFLDLKFCISLNTF